MEVTSLWGTSIAAKPLILDESKALVTRFLGYDQERGEPYLPQGQPLEVVRQRIKAASRFADVFDNISVLTPENSLDVL